MKKSDLIKVGGLISSEPVIVKATWKRPIDGKAEILHKKYTDIKVEGEKELAFNSKNQSWVLLSEAFEDSKNIKADKNKDFHILNFEEHIDFDVGIIRPAFDEMEKVLTIQDDKSRTATLISLCIRLEGDKGKFDQALTYEEACRLEWNLVRTLVDSIKATNKIGITEKKPRPRR
jgi:hypothetical protein